MMFSLFIHSDIIESIYYVLASCIGTRNTKVTKSSSRNRYS
jgi:hypothetical protein